LYVEREELSYLSIDEINPYRLGNEWITGRKWCVFGYAKTVVEV
jgi:hypothetical protein